MKHRSRQDKPFWHYGKDFETIKREMSDRLDRSEFIGAYYNNDLIGFIKIIDAGTYLDIVEILSMIEHRDKAPTNALMAKAVEICDKKSFPILSMPIGPEELWLTSSAIMVSKK